MSKKAIYVNKVFDGTESEARRWMSSPRLDWRYIALLYTSAKLPVDDPYYAELRQEDSLDGETWHGGFDYAFDENVDNPIGPGIYVMSSLRTSFPLFRVLIPAGYVGTAMLRISF